MVALAPRAQHPLAAGVKIRLSVEWACSAQYPPAGRWMKWHAPRSAPRSGAQGLVDVHAGGTPFRLDELPTDHPARVFTSELVASTSS